MGLPPRRRRGHRPRQGRLRALPGRGRRARERLGTLPKIVSRSVPAGTALLGDFTQLSLFVREDVKLDADRSGANFTRNEVVLRSEGRFGLGVLRPQAFVKVALA
ncbi:phage major capsid family protein [Rhodococcus aerolatus]